MNNLLNLFNMASWKPILSALILPPVPFLLMIVIGAQAGLGLVSDFVERFGAVVQRLQRQCTIV
jgi:hypothetical protein